MGSSVSSLPGNGCHCGLAFPWPYSDSVSSALLTSSFEAQLGSPHQERSLGLFLGCGHSCVTLPGQRSFIWNLAHQPSSLPSARQSRPVKSQHSKEPGWFQFLSVLTPLLSPGTIWSKVWPRKHWLILLPPSCGVASLLARAPKYRAVSP